MESSSLLRRLLLVSILVLLAASAGADFVSVDVLEVVALGSGLSNPVGCLAPWSKDADFQRLPSSYKLLRNKSPRRQFDAHLRGGRDAAVRAAAVGVKRRKAVSNLEERKRAAAAGHPGPEVLAMREAKLMVVDVERELAAFRVAKQSSVFDYGPICIRNCNGETDSCSSLRFKSFICCAVSTRLVVLARVEFMFDLWMQSLIHHLCKGASLSLVSLPSYFRLSILPPKLECKREALGSLCRHCPVLEFTVNSMGHSRDLPTPLGDWSLENIFKFSCLASALGMQSLDFGIALFYAARRILPCNWEFISHSCVLWYL